MKDSSITNDQVVWYNFLQQQKLLQKEILNSEEASSYLGIKKSYLYKLSSKNRIPFYRPNGKLIYFKRAELDTWLTKNRQRSIEEIDIESTNYLMKKKHEK